MKYLIFGKNGQLGKSVVEYLTIKNQNFTALDIDEADITDFPKIRIIIEQIKPYYLINCTAYNDVDKAETNSDIAYNINSFAVKNMAEISQLINCKFIHFSTDYVFDGTNNKPYTEKDKANPLSVYGESKLLGEDFIKEYNADFLIFRLSWLYGNGEQNFIYKFLQWAKKNQSLKIVENEISVPTSVETVTNILFSSIANNLTGLYHITNSGIASRYEWALEIKKLYNLQNKIIPAKIEDFNLPAKRPVFSVMNNQLISDTLNISIENWQTAMEKYSRKK
jgi:dTDP-4-dehydrorhamnose reductase